MAIIRLQRTKVDRPAQKSLGWLVTTSFDNISWLAKRQQVEIVEEPKVGRPQFPFTVVVVPPTPDSLGWLTHRRAVEEVQEFFAKAGWQPVLGLGTETLGWFRRAPALAEPEIAVPKVTLWQPSLVTPIVISVDTLGWFTRRVPTVEEIREVLNRSLWQTSTDTLAPVRDQLGWRITRQTYSDPEVLDRFVQPVVLNPNSFWKPWMYLFVQVNVPVITSPLTAVGNQGSPFAYKITATFSPLSFGAVGLPGGLALDPVTGIISGIPSGIGLFTVVISATNANGTGSANLTILLSGQRENNIVPGPSSGDFWQTHDFPVIT